jgi:hypothetical protein
MSSAKAGRRESVKESQLIGSILAEEQDEANGAATGNGATANTAAALSTSSSLAVPHANAGPIARATSAPPQLALRDDVRRILFPVPIGSYLNTDVTVQGTVVEAGSTQPQVSSSVAASAEAGQPYFYADGRLPIGYASTFVCKRRF